MRATTNEFVFQAVRDDGTDGGAIAGVVPVEEGKVIAALNAYRAAVAALREHRLKRAQELLREISGK